MGIPAESDLARLRRWALVAFAGRCGRHIILDWWRLQKGQGSLSKGDRCVPDSRNTCADPDGRPTILQFEDVVIEISWPSAPRSDLTQEDYAVVLRAVENAEHAAANAADLELDTSGYTLQAGGYCSWLGDRYVPPYPKYVHDLDRVHGNSSGDCEIATLAVLCAARAAYHASLTKVASSWQTYGRDAALAKERCYLENCNLCLRHVHQATDLTARLIEPSVLNRDFALLRDVSTREKWSDETPVSSDVFSSVS